MESKPELLRSVEQALGVKLGDDRVGVLLTTSLALIFGLLIFLWKRSTDNRGKEASPLVVPKTYRRRRKMSDPARLRSPCFLEHRLAPLMVLLRVYQRRSKQDMRRQLLKLWTWMIMLKMMINMRKSSRKKP